MACTVDTLLDSLVCFFFHNLIDISVIFGSCSSYRKNRCSAAHKNFVFSLAFAGHFPLHPSSFSLLSLLVAACCSASLCHGIYWSVIITFLMLLYALYLDFLCTSTSPLSVQQHHCTFKYPKTQQKSILAEKLPFTLSGIVTHIFCTY